MYDNVSSGSQRTYVPSVSGTYYLAVIARGPGQGYSVTLEPTGKSFGDGSAANNIPGTPLAMGATRPSAVDTNTKPRDVFALALTAGQQVQFTFTLVTGSLDFRLANPGSQVIPSGSSGLAMYDNGSSGSQRT
jgi:hypothetical protein